MNSNRELKNEKSEKTPVRNKTFIRHNNTKYMNNFITTVIHHSHVRILLKIDWHTDANQFCGTSELPPAFVCHLNETSNLK